MRQRNSGCGCTVHALAHRLGQLHSFLPPTDPHRKNSSRSPLICTAAVVPPAPLVTPPPIALNAGGGCLVRPRDVVISRSTCLVAVPRRLLRAMQKLLPQGPSAASRHETTPAQPANPTRSPSTPHIREASVRPLDHHRTPAVSSRLGLPPGKEALPQATVTTTNAPPPLPPPPLAQRHQRKNAFFMAKIGQKLAFWEPK